MNITFIISGKYSTTMYEEHACKLYQAQTHCSCWIHLRWSRVLDFAGESLETVCLFVCISNFDNLLGWDLLFWRLCHHIWWIWCSESDAFLWKFHLNTCSLLRGGRMETGGFWSLYIESVWILEICRLVGFWIWVISVFWGEK